MSCIILYYLYEIKLLKIEVHPKFEVAKEKKFSAHVKFRRRISRWELSLADSFFYMTSSSSATL